MKVGLNDDRYEASMRFRDYLSLGLSSGQRQQRLKNLIKETLSPNIAGFVLTKSAAIRLLAEHVRQDSDKAVAHSFFKSSWFEGAIARAGQEKAGLAEVLDIVLYLQR